MFIRILRGLGKADWPGRATPRDRNNQSESDRCRFPRSLCLVEKVMFQIYKPADKGQNQHRIHGTRVERGVNFRDTFSSIF